MKKYVKNVKDFWSSEMYSHEFTSIYKLGKERDIHHENFLEVVTEVSQSFNDELPSYWPKFLESMELEEGSVSWTMIRPARIVPIHQDYFVNLRKNYNVSLEQCSRYLLMLDDWSFGQLVELDDLTITRWKKGDVWEFDYTVSHWAVNASNINFYTCQISRFKDV